METLSSSSLSVLKTYKGILLILLLFVTLAFGLYRGYMPDDAFIHIGYAKDLLEGKGFSFAGNRTYGSTSPLWPMLVAAVSFAVGDYQNAVRLLSISFSAAAILFMFVLVRFRFTNTAALASACLLGFNAYFLRWSCTGMESTAAVFFMLLLLFLLFEEHHGTAGKGVYFIAGISPLVRPEFYLFIFVLLLYLFFFKSFLRFRAKLLLLCLPVIVWNGFALLYYGTIVPSTFVAKAGDNLFSTDWSTLVRSLTLFLSGNPVEICFLGLASLLLILKAQQPLGHLVSRAARSEFAVMAGWFILFYLYYILKNVTIISRYSLIVLPLLIFLTIKVLTKVCTRLRFSERDTRVVFIGITSLSLIVHGVFTLFVVKPDADSFIRGFQQEYGKIATILSEEHCKDGGVIVSEVGIIGVYSGLKIYDLVGLVDKERHLFHSKREYFFMKRPQYLVSRGEVTVEELQDSSVSFHEIYRTTIAGFGINQKGSNTVSVYRVFWKEERTQD